MPKTNVNPADVDPASFKNLVDLMALFAEASGRFAALEIDLQEQFLKLVDERRADYAELQQTIANSEESIEELALLNPKWFAKAKSLKCPYGTVAFRKTTKLVVKNEEVTVLLIQQAGEAAKFIRTKEELDLEALEKLDDADLKKFRITRETTESCTVKPAKIDLGKAVAKAAEESSDKAA